MVLQGYPASMEDPVKEISRKELLKKGAVVGAVGAVSVALAYCKKKPADSSAPAAGGCGDVSGLTQAEKDQRTQLQYTDKSPKADQPCSGCALFVAAAAGASCGTCNLVKGPISPDGWCSSWVKKG